MKIFGILSFISFIISLFLGVYVLIKAPEKKINMNFFIFSLFASALCFIEYEFRLAESLDRAFFWSKAQSIWPFVLAFSLHFALEIKEINKRKNLIYLLIYTPAIIIFLVDLRTNIITDIPLNVPWGWSIQRPNNIIVYLTASWATIVLILSVYVLFKYYLEFSGIKKKQIFLIFVAFSINLFFALITDVVFPFFHFKIPELSNTLSVIAFAIIAFAMWKHQLFEINPNSMTEKLLLTLNDSVFLTNYKQEIIEVNKAGLKMLNYQSHELIGKRIDFIVDKSSEQILSYKNISKILELVVNDFEVNFCCKNEKIITVSVSITKTNLGNKNKFGYILVARDISARKQAEEDLNNAFNKLDELVKERTKNLSKVNEKLVFSELAASENEKKYKNLTNNLPGMIYRSLPDWSVSILSNSKLVCGFEAELFLNKKVSWFNLIYHEDIKKVSEQSNLLNKKPTSMIQEYRITSKHNKIKYVLDYKTSVFDGNGNFIGVDGIVFDVTQQKLNEQELIKTKERAEESDRLKTAFLQNLSHEIRTPTNAIIGFSRLLSSNDLNPKERNKYLNYLQSNGESLVKIIDDIIDVSKIQKKQLRIQTKDFDLNGLFQELKSYYKHVLLANNKTITLILQLPSSYGTEFYINSDQTRIKQVMNNLISNAIKYCEHGEIIFGYKIFGTQMQLFVQDSGPGIPEKVLPHIFERFYQYSDKFISTEQGTGLGLSISYDLASLLGGNLSVQTMVGIGTAFYLTLPIISVDVSKKLITRKKYDFDNGSLQGKTILIVDDEEPNYALTSRIFKNTEAIISWVKNGKLATQWVTNNLCDLIIMDIKMPEMNGIEATRIIKEFNKNLPIVILSAYALDATREQAFNAGCDDFFIRPVASEIFIEKIITLINKQQN